MFGDHAYRRNFLQLAASALASTALGESLMAQTSSASATGIPTRIRSNGFLVYPAGTDTMGSANLVFRSQRPANRM